MIVVLADGCFDPFHVGHLYHLQAARKLGDRLIVAVTRDAYVNKGAGRPIFTQDERMAVLLALRCVDEVYPVKTAMEAIARFQPDIYVKGKEYEGQLPEQAFVESYGGRVVFTKGRIFSSTALVSGSCLKAAGASDRRWDRR